jgi:hypothetical protein
MPEGVNFSFINNYILSSKAGSQSLLNIWMVLNMMNTTTAAALILRVPG